MSLEFESRRIEELVNELAQMTGESPAEVVEHSLEARKAHVQRVQEALRFLHEEVWPSIPEDLRRKGISKAEREEILGYGPDGV
jgi:antitoxin VapB